MKYTGSGSVLDTDFKYIKYVGKTKSNVPITIELFDAFCRSNIDWKFAEKDDTVPEIEYEACYDDEKLAAGNFEEPWTIEVPDGLTAGNNEILLGVGKFYVGSTAADAVCVGLSRGGGSFTVERNYREINADNDPGAVKDRIEQTEGRAKLKLNVLQWLTKLSTLYPGIKTVNASAG